MKSKSICYCGKEVHDGVEHEGRRWHKSCWRRHQIEHKRKVQMRPEY